MPPIRHGPWQGPSRSPTISFHPNPPDHQERWTNNQAVVHRDLASPLGSQVTLLRQRGFSMGARTQHNHLTCSPVAGFWAPEAVLNPQRVHTIPTPASRGVTTQPRFRDITGPSERPSEDGITLGTAHGRPTSYTRPIIRPPHPLAKQTKPKRKRRVTTRNPERAR